MPVYYHCVFYHPPREKNPNISLHLLRVLQSLTAGSRLLTAGSRLKQNHMIYNQIPFDTQLAHGWLTANVFKILERAG